MKLLVSLFFASVVVAIVLGCLLASPLPARADHGVQRVILADTDCGCQPPVQVVRQVRYAQQEVCEPIYTIQQEVRYAPLRQVRQVRYDFQPVQFRQRQKQRADVVEVRPVKVVRQRSVGDYGGALNISVGGRRSSVRVGGLRLRVR